MNDTVIIIGAISSYAARRYEEAVAHLNVGSVFVESDGSPTPLTSNANDRISLASLEADEADHLISRLRNRKIIGVVPGGELAVPLADAVARRLDLTCHAGSTERFRDKGVMRESLALGKVAQPRVISLVGPDDKIPLLREEELPVIIKPTDGAASFFVKKCESRKDVAEAIGGVRSHGRSNATGVAFSRRAIVEEFVEGREYSAEVVIRAGRIVLQFLHMKLLSQEPFFDEIGHVTLPWSHLEVAGGLDVFIDRIVRAMDLVNGVAHIEFRVDINGRPRVIELGARVAGDMISELVELSTGISLEREFIRVRSGLKSSDLVGSSNLSKIHGVKFVFGNAPLWHAAPGINMVIEQAAQAYAPLSGSSPFHVTRRTGLVVFHADSPEAATAFIEQPE